MLTPMAQEKVKLKSKIFGTVEYHLPMGRDVEGDVRFIRAEGQFGQFVFQSTKGSNYYIWQGSTMLEDDTTLAISHEKKWFTLSFNLKSSLHYIIEGMPAGVIAARCYNFFSTNKARAELKLRKKETYNSFGIIFEKDFLERWKGVFNASSDFLTVAANRMQGKIFSEDIVISSEMLSIIEDIMHFDYSNDVPNIYLEVKISELLLLCLNSVPEQHYPARILLSKNEELKLEEARKYLLENIHTKVSVPELAHLVGINDFKLKQGFKFFYGTTIASFKLNERMQKAMKLLTETNVPIKQISSLSGYNSVPNFSAAFKRTFGHSPKHVRGHRKK